MSSNISIRFNAASMLEDSDDDDILCGSPKDALHFEVHKAPEPEVHPVTASPAPADAGVNGCDGDDKPDKVESRNGAAEGKVNGEGENFVFVNCYLYLGISLVNGETLFFAL